MVQKEIAADLAGIIFDMDDTLVATAALWTAAEEALLSRLGHHRTDELALQFKGMNAMDVAATIHGLVHADMPLEQCQRLLRDTLIANFQTHLVQAMPGAVQCVRRLKLLAPLAVASGSPLPAIHTALRQLGLEKDFRVIISSESVPRGKPHPDVFLAAAAALGVAPQRCLVLEDSLIGVRAAHAAGMACFAVPSSFHHEIAALATRVYTSLAQITEADANAAIFPAI